LTRHDDLLSEGLRTAPEPQTAEERTSRIAKRGLAGAAIAGGVAVKTGVAAKAIAWLVAFHGASALWRTAGWVGLVIGLMLMAVVVAFATRGSGGEIDPRRLRRLLLALPVVVLAFTIGSHAAFEAAWWWVLAGAAAASSVVVLVLSRRSERNDYRGEEART
jgi:hypothetical protein